MFSGVDHWVLFLGVDHSDRFTRHFPSVIVMESPCNAKSQPQKSISTKRASQRRVFKTTWFLALTWRSCPKQKVSFSSGRRHKFTSHNCAKDESYISKFDLPSSQKYLIHLAVARMRLLRGARKGQCFNFTCCFTSVLSTRGLKRRIENGKLCVQTLVELWNLYRINFLPCVLHQFVSIILDYNLLSL